MNDKLIVLLDKILVIQEKIEEKTESGIYIPVESQKKANKGVVQKVGEGLPDQPMKVKAGDTVYYREHSGTSIEVEDVEYLVLAQVEVQILLQK